MRALSQREHVDAAMAREAEELRASLIALGGEDGFAEISLGFDGVACWQSYMSWSGDETLDTPASFDARRLVLNGTLQFVPLMTALPGLTLLAQNVGLHQAILQKLEPGASLRLLTHRAGPLQARTRLGPHGRGWQITATSVEGER